METKFSCINILRDYFDRIFSDVKTMKALLLDEETTYIVSLAISQSEIMQKDVFLVEPIEKAIVSSAEEEKLSHLSAVCILRPSEENLLKLTKALSNPKFGSYYLYFTNKLPPNYLQRLATTDKLEVIRQVFEIFSDIYSINHDLFSLNIPSTIGLTKPLSRWKNIDHATMDRIVSGLFGMLLCTRKLPIIRYQRSSELCLGIADRLHQILREDRDLMNSYTGRSSGRHKTTIDGVDQTSTLLIIDRREDPVTPLLHQWTYQGMLHELLHIDQNRIHLKQQTKEELKTIALSCTQDSFYEDNMFNNFGDLAMNISAYVQEYQQARQRTSKVESIEDMKRFIEVYPEFSRMAGNVSKHVTLTSELDKVIKNRLLLSVSELEQDIACSENRNEHYRQITDLIRDPRYANIDKLKLVLLYSLRYENDEKISQLKTMLRDNGIREEQISLVDALTEYAGAQVRSCDLFHNKNILSRAKSRFTTVLKNVPNVYTQHESYLTTIIDQALKGKLRENEFPATESFNSREKLSNLYVFIVGGATYEEAKEVALMNKRNLETQIILGGTTVHNSVSFLAEVSQLIINERF